MSTIQPVQLFRSMLPKIRKPARYLGGESGAIVKSDVDFRVALCFPDLYEIGMTNNAMRILYAGLNELEGVACERVFSVGLDYEELLRSTATPLYGLETGRPISEFDVLAFTVGYELAATNILAILELSGIPLLSSERNQSQPVVIAGGPAITNPAPYAKILDGVWIGEAENEFFKLIESMRLKKIAGADRSDIIRMFQAHKAVWMPGKRAIRNIHDGFSSAPYKYSFPAASVKPVQDHGVVEIMRGCPNGCRFCHAGYFYRPRRLRDVSRILEEVRTQIRVSGHREISLSSLSSGDFPGIATLVSILNRMWSAEGISFQLPSLKIESFPLEIIEDLAGTRKSGLTFAVETPLEQWQLTINKRASVEKIRAILAEAGKRGYRVAKFYFMIGLPLPVAETTEEEAIVSFIRDIADSSPGIRLNITIATFVPKPHTPFQWSSQLPWEEASRRVYNIKDYFRGDARIKISYHEPYLSWLEGLIARGDDSVGDVILSAYKHGARFDAWDDLFDKEAWHTAIEECVLDANAVNGSKPDNAILPWSDVSLRVSKKFLLEERDKSLKPETTHACVEKCDLSCGACSDALSVSDGKQILEELRHLEESLDKDESSRTVGSLPAVLSRTAPSNGTRWRVLFNYSRISGAAFFAHHELHAMISGSLERVGLRIAYSEGFNPMPRLEISEPLPLGFESVDDYGVAILAGTPPDDVSHLLNSAGMYTHASLRFLDSRSIQIPDGIKFPSLSSIHWGSEFSIDVLDSGLKASTFATALSDVVAEIDLLKAATISLDSEGVRLMLPFTGIKSFGFSALFEKASGIPLRDARISVRRLRQYAKSPEGQPQSYFETYQNLFPG